MSDSAACADIIGHVPREKRLLHVVAVLLQSQTFPFAGDELEGRIEGLLGGISGSLRLSRALCLDEGTGRSSLVSELNSQQMEALLHAARSYAQDLREELRELLVKQCGSLEEAVRSFRRGCGLDASAPAALSALIDVAYHEGGAAQIRAAGVPWALSLKGVGALQARALMELLSGQLSAAGSISFPLAVALPRLTGVPASKLADLRRNLLGRHRTFTRFFDQLRRDGVTSTSAEPTLRLEDFRLQLQQLDLPTTTSEEDKDALAGLLFTSCDGRHDGVLDQEELQQAFASVSGPASLARLRMAVVLMWGNWRNALTAAGVGAEDPITSGTLIALGSAVDIGYEDALTIFRELLTTGQSQMSSQQFMQRVSGDALGFSLQEFVLRAWLACDVGTTLTDAATRLLPPSSVDSSLSSESFCSLVCGVEVNQLSGSLATSSRLAPGKKAEASKVSKLPTSPALSAGEAAAAYQALRAKYRSVNVAAVRAELGCNRSVSDVLALDRSSAAPGETVFVRYRLSQEAQAQLGQNPFVAAVPATMVWMAGGGGCWMSNRQAVTDLSGSRAYLKNRREGVLRIQVSPVTGCGEGSAIDFRLFASPDGFSIGKQIGSAVRFEMKLPGPPTVIVEASSLSPTSLRLLWAPPLADKVPSSFVVRGRPVGLDVEELADGARSTEAWSHELQSLRKLHCYDVSGLLPGARYRFEVTSLSAQAGALGSTRPSPAASPSASPDTSPRDAPSGTLQLDALGTLGSSALVDRAALLSASESNASRSVEVQMPLRPRPRTPGRPMLVDRYLGGDLVLQWKPRDSAALEDGSVRGQPAYTGAGVDFQLYWDVPPGSEDGTLAAPDEAAEMAAEAEDAEQLDGHLEASEPPDSLDLGATLDLRQVAAGDQAVAGDQSGERVRTRRVFWPCSAPFWVRRTADGMVECIVRPPPPEGSSFSSARFSVRSVDSESAQKSPLSDFGAALPLTTGAEATLRDVRAARLLGEAALMSGGLSRFLDAAEDAGLVGSGAAVSEKAGFRKKLFDGVEQAGGLQVFVESLEGVNMASFSNGMRVLSALQHEDERLGQDLSLTRAQDWVRMVQLIEEGGGVTAVESAFKGIDMSDLVASAQRLTDLGLIQSRKDAEADASHQEVVFKEPNEDRAAYPTESAKRSSKFLNTWLKTALLGEGSKEEADSKAGFLGQVAEHVADVHISQRQSLDLATAVGNMARSGGRGGDASWHGVAKLSSAEGGPLVTEPLLRYFAGHFKEVMALLIATELEPAELIEFLTSVGAAGLVGAGVDSTARQDFLMRLADAGGATVLFSALKGVDLEALRPALQMVKVAGLHKKACLVQNGAGRSKADTWVDLAETVEKRWGGAQKALNSSVNFISAQKDSVTEEDEQDEFTQLLLKTGGRTEVRKLLERVNSAGGVERLLQLIGPTDLGKVGSMLSDLRKGGGQLEDLEKILQVANEAGGMSRLLKALEGMQDRSNITKMLNFAEELRRFAQSDDSNWFDMDDSVKYAEVLSRVMSECSATGFLKAFSQVRLSSVAGMVPNMISAGLLRTKGAAKSEGEVAAVAEAMLRWISRAGGATRISHVLINVEGRLFTKMMEQVGRSGIGKLSFSALEKVGDWLAEMAGHAGNLEAFADVAKGTNLLELVISLHRLDAASSGLKWKPPNPLDFAQPSGGADDGGGTAMPNPTDGIAKGWARLPEALPPESTQYSQEVLKGLLELAETCEGTTRLLQIHKRVSLDRLEKAVDFLGAARLLRNSNKVRPRSTFFAPTCDELAEPESPPEIGHDFEPWMRLANLVRQFGGASDFCDRAEAVDFRQLEAYIEILSVAGLTSKATNGDRDDDNDSDPCEISPELIRAWRDVVAVVAQNGGPKLFLDGFQGIDVVDFLQMVQLLRQAGLARSLDVNPPDTEPSILYIDGGADDSRVRNTKLQEFVDKVRQAGGFPAFWHALRRLDLSRVKGDLYCLGVIRKKLCEFVSEDLWHLIQDPDHLEEVLDRSLGGRRQEEGDLTITQRQSIMKRLKEVGGVEGFLKAFDKVSLSTLLEQHRALQEAGISSLSVIDSLAQIGALVQNQVDHLEGLRAVAATLVRWGNSHHYGEDPERLWKALHQQVSWLLAAIEENGALLRETSRHDKTSGHGKAKPQRKEPELTPARLAQFLQALRPMGGVQGFLAAFRGLDLATAAGQARVMHDSSVRSVETARHLAGIYRLIRGDPSHLRGLEHFLRGFGGPVFAEAQTQGNSHEDRLKVAERWQRLTDYMATASGRPGAAPFTELEAATSSGPDQALDVLLLGLRLSEAGGIRATSEEWLELCAEIKASHPPPDSTLRPSSAASTGALDTSGSLVTLHSGTGLTGILSRLRSTSSSSCSGRSKAQRLPSRGAPQPGRARPTSASSQPPLECQHCGARLADKTLPRGGSAGALDFSRALPSAALSWPSAVRGRSQLPIVDEVEDLIPENDDEFLQCTEKDSLVRMKRPASASRGRSEPAILRPLSAGALTSLAKSGPGLMRIDRSASPAPVAGPGWSPALGPRIVAAKSTF